MSGRESDVVRANVIWKCRLPEGTLHGECRAVQNPDIQRRAHNMEFKLRKHSKPVRRKQCNYELLADAREKLLITIGRDMNSRLLN